MMVRLQNLPGMGGGGSGGGVVPVSTMDQWRVNLPVDQTTTTEGLPVAKPTTQYSSWRRVGDAYRQGLLTYTEAYEILISQFGYDPNIATATLADPSVESTEFEELVITPTPPDETPQGQPQDDSTVPAEEVRGQAQDRPWRESDWTMIILGGIALYWVGRKVAPSIRGG